MLHCAVIDEIVGFTQPGQKIPFLPIGMARRFTGSFRRNKTKGLKPVAVMPQHPFDSRGYRLPRSCRQGDMTEMDAIPFKPPHHAVIRNHVIRLGRQPKSIQRIEVFRLAYIQQFVGRILLLHSRISTCNPDAQATSFSPAIFLCSRSIRRRYPTRWFS